jgi:hypothetical protein
MIGVKRCCGNFLWLFYPRKPDFLIADAQSCEASFVFRPGTDIEKKVCVYLAAFLTPSERRGKHEV